MPQAACPDVSERMAQPQAGLRDPAGPQGQIAKRHVMVSWISAPESVGVALFHHSRPGTRAASGYQQFLF
jgi:hypothetical protein